MTADGFESGMHADKQTPPAKPARTLVASGIMHSPIPGQVINHPAGSGRH